MLDCVFCKIVSGEIPAKFVYQDSQIVVFNDINPRAEVHLLVIPKQHIKSLAEIDTSHSQLLAHMMLQLPILAKTAGLAHGFRTIINTGRGGGQEVDHLHMHILGSTTYLPKF